MKVGLTMRTLIRWEQLMNKPFSMMDYSREEDMEALLYCSVLSCNPGEKMYTIDEFRHIMQNEKLVKQMITALSRESMVMAQFRQVNEEEINDGHIDGSIGFIRDIISTLIIDGLNASYVMDEMDLCDLPMFISAYEQRRKEQMESDRLWTYLSILPHVDHKYIPDVRIFYPFPWEQKEMEEAAAKSIKEDADKLEAFFKQGKNLITQNYGG